MSEFKAVSLDGEVTLTSQNGQIIFPSHRKNEVRTYKITFTDDVGNSGFTYYGQAPFSGGDITISNVYILNDWRTHYYSDKHDVYTYRTVLDSDYYGGHKLKKDAVLWVRVNLTGDDIVVSDITTDLIWIEDKNNNKLLDRKPIPKEEPESYASPVMVIREVDFDLNGLASAPYEHTETEYNNAKYYLKYKNSNGEIVSITFHIIDGQDYIYQTIDNGTVVNSQYEVQSCPDPRQTGGISESAYLRGYNFVSDINKYGRNCIIIPTSTSNVVNGANTFHKAYSLKTPVGTAYWYWETTRYGYTTWDVSRDNRYATSNFAFYKADSNGNPIGNPLVRVSGTTYITYEVDPDAQTTTDSDSYVGQVYLRDYPSDSNPFEQAARAALGSSSSASMVLVCLDQESTFTPVLVECKKVSPCDIDTSTYDRYKCKISAGDKVYDTTSSPISPQVYSSTINGIVKLSSGYQLYYDLFNRTYAIFDDDGSGNPAKTTDKNGNTLSVGDYCEYDDYQASWGFHGNSFVVSRIQSNGTVTLYNYYDANDSNLRFTTTGSKLTKG